MSAIEQRLKVKITTEGVENAKRNLDGVNNNIGKMVKTVGLAVAAWQGLKKAIAVVNDAMDNFNRAQQAMRQITGALESTGKQSMFTAQELSKLAGELQKVSNFGDEDILQSATISLLRFDGMSKDVFVRAQSLAVDMGEAMGGLENASRTLGISLADPELGLTRLRRAGVMFTEEQHNMIKALIAGGESAKAQKIMLDALESKYGGMAVASITATTQLKNAWDDYMEALGKSFAFIDGIKHAFVSSLQTIASETDTTSVQAQISVLDMQEKWAKAFIQIIERFKQVVEAATGVIIGLVDIVIKAGNLIRQSLKASFGYIKNMIIELAKFVVKYNPVILLLQGVEAGYKALTGKDLGVSKMKKDIIGNIESYKSDVDKLNKGVSESFDQLVNTSKFAFSFLVDGWKETNASIRKQISDTEAHYDRLRDAARVGKGSPLLPDDGGMKELLDELGKVEDALGKMLQVRSDYYDAVGKYSDKWLEAQIKNYEHQLRVSSDSLLTELEIQEMVTARRLELQREVSRHNESIADEERQLLTTQLSLELEIAQNREQWYQIRVMQIEQEAEAQRIAGVNIVLLEKWKTEQIKKLQSEVPESMKNMADLFIDQNERIKESMERLLEDGIYRIITGADSMKSAWQRALEAMKDITARIISQIVADLIKLYVVQQFVGLASPMGGAQPAGGTTPAPPAPPPGKIRSIGGNVGTVVGGGSEDHLIRAINDLRDEIKKDKDQHFTLLVDGVPVRNALKRIDYNTYVLGGSSV